MIEDLKAALRARDVQFAELENGDIFLRRPGDRQSMYIRTHADGTYDWSQNSARNDTNLMDYRTAAHHGLPEVLQRVDDFLGLVVSGRVVIDTLGMVHSSMAQGMGRENAERIAAIARRIAIDLHESGMPADEIKVRFEEVHEQLRRERIAEISTRPESS